MIFWVVTLSWVRFHCERCKANSVPSWIAEGKRLEELTTEDTESTEEEQVGVVLEVAFKKRTVFVSLRFILDIGF
jgi:endogenous inhibitor of DNA gyrase (YacG/DUF329 family)